jgi:predicted dehydrogenase
MNNSKIRVGIIGVHPEKGWATIAHIPALQSLPEDFEITAISNSDFEQAKRAAAKFGIPHALATTAELVEHPDVDLVIVTVRVTHHLELIAAAIKAGKAVFSESPLGVTLEQAIHIAQLAKSRNVQTTIGLQTRAAPAFNYVKDLVKEGYVGEVLSTTLISSGLNWGEAQNETFKYTLDSASGAGMLNVPFAHSIDAILYALDTTVDTIDANLAIRRKTSRVIETGEEVPMKTADQIAVSGTLKNGTFFATHFRGGLSKATNFHWEINGTKGDLVITSPVGYVGIGGFRIQGANGEQSALQDFVIPEKYGAAITDLGIAQNVALAYQRLATDRKSGSRLSPTFEDGVELQRLIDRIEKNAGSK